MFPLKIHGEAHRAPQRSPFVITRPTRPLGTYLYSLVLGRLIYLIDPSADSTAHPNGPDFGTLNLSSTLDDLGILVHPHTQDDIFNTIYILLVNVPNTSLPYTLAKNILSNTLLLLQPLNNINQ